MTKNHPQIVVVGSINMDLVVRCSRIPTPGETIIADSATEIPGGKGANQAVAAARAGGDVRMIGRVGDDAFADRLIENLHAADVNTDGIAVTEQCASGIAIVAVDAIGENSIMVIPGANGRMSVDDVSVSADVIRAADVLLLQLEIPMDAVSAAARIARDAGVLTILDPAPMPDSLPDELLKVSVICPNQTEAASIIGRPIRSVHDARQAVTMLRDRGVNSVVITLGQQGAVVGDETETTWIEPKTVTAVDTTAAGDAFAGALAVRLHECQSLVEAARFASVAGAIATTRIGAQPAMPTRTEIDGAT